MNIVLNVRGKENPTDNDIIVYMQGEWCVVPKERFLSKELTDISRENEALRKRIDDLEKNVQTIAKIIKER